MTAFTIEVQGSDAAREIWQALEPADDVDGTPWGYTEPVDVAEMVATNQSIAEGPNWRVCVWLGAEADTSTEPAFIWEPVLALLNDWEERHGYGRQVIDGTDIWVEVIIHLHGYDQAATEQIDQGTNDRFVADGRIIRYDPESQQWIDAGAYPEQHFTAWLTVDPTCLESHLADVVVLRDVKVGLAVDDDGNEVSRWESTDEVLATCQTDVDVRQDYPGSGVDVHAEAKAKAVSLLAAAGWQVTADGLWEPVPTGYTVEVEPTDAA